MLKHVLLINPNFIIHNKSGLKLDVPETLLRLPLEVIDVFSLLQNVRLLFNGHMKLFALAKADGLHLSPRLEMHVLHFFLHRCGSVINWAQWRIFLCYLSYSTLDSTTWYHNEGFQDKPNPPKRRHKTFSYKVICNVEHVTQICHGFTTVETVRRW